MSLIPADLQRLPAAPKRTRYKAVLRGPRYRPQRYVIRLKKSDPRHPMNNPQSKLYADTLAQRSQILAFLTAAGAAGAVLVEKGSLLPTEIPPAQLTVILDQHLGVDRAALNAERAAELTPGGHCAC